MNKIVLVPESDTEQGVYNASGEVRAVLNEGTVGSGVYAANGAYRVSLADEGSGVYATDGSYNFWYNSNGSINFPGGILKGVSETDLISELYAVDGTRPAALADFEAWRFFIPELGPELVTNGGFDTDTNWAKTSGWSISGGQAVASSVVSFGSISLTDFPFEAGKLYCVTTVISSVSAGEVRVSFTTGTQVSGTNRSSAGTYIEYLTANTLNDRLNLQAGPSGFTGAVDYISIREVMLGESPDFNSPTLRECTFDEWFAYTASSPAAETYTDGSGVLRVATEGTNLVAYSDDVSGWTMSNATGTTTALVENSASSIQHYAYQLVSYSSFPAKTGTLQAKIKAGVGSRNFALRLAGASGSAYVVFNPSTGAHVVSDVTGSAWSVTSYTTGPVDADGYYPVSASFTHTETTGAITPFIQLVDGITRTYNGDGSSSVLVKNIQLEDGLTATPFRSTGATPEAVDTPRQDYSSGSRRLLLENASTNLLVRSQQLNTSWTKTEATVVEGVEVSPDGTQTACRLIENGTFNPHQISQSFGPATSGVSYTISVYAKYETRRYLMVTFGGGAFGSSQYATFDLQSGTVSGSAVGSPDIQALSNGWYRCIFTATCTSTTTGTAFLALSDVATGRSPNYTGDGASSILIWGAQVETSSFASSYIPTQGSTVTRAINTAEFSPMLEAIMQRSAASVLVRATQSGPSTGRIVGIDGTNSLLSLSSTSDMLAYNGTNFLFKTVGAGWPYSPFGAIMGFNSSGRAITGNGLTPATDANAAGTRTTIYLARSATVGSSYGQGTYKLVAIYPTRLSDASLQALAVA